MAPRVAPVGGGVVWWAECADVLRRPCRRLRGVATGRGARLVAENPTLGAADVAPAGQGRRTGPLLPRQLKPTGTPRPWTQGLEANYSPGLVANLPGRSGAGRGPPGTPVAPLLRHSGLRLGRSSSDPDLLVHDLPSCSAPRFLFSTSCSPTGRSLSRCRFFKSFCVPVAPPGGPPERWRAALWPPRLGRQLDRHRDGSLDSVPDRSLCSGVPENEWDGIPAATLFGPARMVPDPPVAGRSGDHAV